MSSNEMPDAEDKLPEEMPSELGDQDDNSLTEKLSKELNNWRRQRNVSRPKRPENGNSPNGPSEPARTIKVRGHETLVVRKPKLAPKPPSSPAPQNS